MLRCSVSRIDESAFRLSFFGALGLGAQELSLTVGALDDRGKLMEVALLSLDNFGDAWGALLANLGAFLCTHHRYMQ